MRNQLKSTIFTAFPAFRNHTAGNFPVNPGNFQVTGRMRQVSTFLRTQRKSQTKFSAFSNIQKIKSAALVSTALAGCMFSYTNSEALCESPSSENGTSTPPTTTTTATTETPKEHLHDPFLDPEYRYLGYSGRIGRILAFTANKVRFLGYSSDVGESARPLLDPRWVKFFYGITWAYVFSDVGFNMYKDIEQGKDEATAARTGVKVLAFQSIASVALPTVIIHTAVHQSQKLFASAPGRLKVIGPVLVGFAILPILPYIDEPAEEIIDHCFDKYWPAPGSEQH